MKTGRADLKPPSASLLVLLRVNVLLTGIIAGAVLGIWLTEVSMGTAAELWISYHQVIRMPYTNVIPPLGALALVGSVATLIWSRRPLVDQRATMAAVICLVLGMVVTVGVHFPVNALVDNWLPTAPPGDWQQVRGRWLLAHAVRSLLAVAAFGMLVIAATRRDSRAGIPAATAGKVGGRTGRRTATRCPQPSPGHPTTRRPRSLANHSHRRRNPVDGMRNHNGGVIGLRNVGGSGGSRFSPAGWRHAVGQRQCRRNCE